MPSGSVSWHKDGNILEVVQSCNPITYPRIPLVLQSMPTSFDIHIKAHDGDGSIVNLLIFLGVLERKVFQIYCSRIPWKLLE
jgi:hypothetical protein